MNILIENDNLNILQMSLELIIEDMKEAMELSEEKLIMRIFHNLLRTYMMAREAILKMTYIIL